MNIQVSSARGACSRRPLPAAIGLRRGLCRPAAAGRRTVPRVLDGSPQQHRQSASPEHELQPARHVSEGDQAASNHVHTQKEDDGSLQITLLLSLSVALLMIPWASSHPVFLIAPGLLAITPVVGNGVRSLLREAAVGAVRAVRISMGLLPRPHPAAHHHLHDGHHLHGNYSQPHPHAPYQQQQQQQQWQACRGSMPASSEHHGSMPPPGSSSSGAVYGPYSTWPRQQQAHWEYPQGAAMSSPVPLPGSTSSSGSEGRSGSLQRPVPATTSGAAGASAVLDKPSRQRVRSPRGSPSSSMDNGDAPAAAGSELQQARAKHGPQPSSPQQLDYHEFLGLEHPQQLQQLQQQQQPDYHEFMEHHARDPRVLSRTEKKQLHQHHNHHVPPPQQQQ